LLESGLPVYWCPCFGRDGYQTFYKADQAKVVGACAARVQNFFVYCLHRSQEDPLSFLDAGPKPLPIAVGQLQLGFFSPNSVIWLE
jgi:hypothetical protein